MISGDPAGDKSRRGPTDTPAGDKASGQIFSAWVPGKPTPKGRARHGRTRSGKPITYSDPKTVIYENWVALHVRQAYDGPIIDYPVSLGIKVYLKRPKRPKHKDYPAGRPDLDNYVKAILDGLKHVVSDDALCCRLVASKEWAGADASPGVSIELGRI